jgi:hypothetical protein
MWICGGINRCLRPENAQQAVDRQLDGTIKQFQTTVTDKLNQQASKQGDAVKVGR